MRFVAILCLLSLGCVMQPRPPSTPPTASVSAPEPPGPLDSLIEPADFAPITRGQSPSTDPSTRVVSTKTPQTLPASPAPRQPASTQNPEQSGSNILWVRTVPKEEVNPKTKTQSAPDPPRQPTPTLPRKTAPATPTPNPIPVSTETRLLSALRSQTGDFRTNLLRLLEHFLLVDNPIGARQILEEFKDQIPEKDYELTLLQSQIYRRLGDNNAATKHLHEAMESERRYLPLRVREILFIEGVMEGYGRYKPRPSSIFRPGDVAKIYCDLENCTLREDSPLFHLELTLNWDLIQPDGRITPIPSLPTERVKVSYRVARKENCLTSQMILPKNIPPGSYRIRLTVIDLNKTRLSRTTIELPFELE